MKVTVIGSLYSTDEHIVINEQIGTGETWMHPVLRIYEQYGQGNFQFHSIHQGVHTPVGTWENLPKAPPAYKPRSGPPERFTIFGFDVAGDQEFQDYFDAPEWAAAAILAWRQRGAAYQFICAVQGHVDPKPLGTWTQLKAILQAHADETDNGQRRVAGGG